MKYKCPKCDYVFEGEVRFCPNCGQPFSFPLKQKEETINPMSELNAVDAHKDLLNKQSVQKSDGDNEPPNEYEMLLSHPEIMKNATIASFDEEIKKTKRKRTIGLWMSISFLIICAVSVILSFATLHKHTTFSMVTTFVGLGFLVLSAWSFVYFVPMYGGEVTELLLARKLLLIEKGEE